MANFEDIVSARTTNARRRAALQEYQEIFELKNQLTAFGVFGMNTIFREALAICHKDIYSTIKAFVDVTGAAITRNREGRIKAIHIRDTVMVR